MRSLLGVLLACSVCAQSGYHQTKKWTIGGAAIGNSLALDAENHRLYVSRGNEVVVVDTINGQVTGRLTGFQGTRGVAIAPDLNRGFVTDGPAASLTVFDTKTLTKLADGVSAGRNPGATGYDVQSRQVFVLNGGINGVTVLDATVGAPIGTFDLVGKPDAAVPNGEFALFLTMAEKNALARADVRKLLIERNWPTPGCDAPTSLAVDSATRRVFVGCQNKILAVFDMDAGKMLTSVPICSAVNNSAYDPGTRLIFNACSDGNITVVRQNAPDVYSVVETISSPPETRSMALNGITHELYVPAQEGADGLTILVYTNQ